MSATSGCYNRVKEGLHAPTERRKLEGKKNPSIVKWQGAKGYLSHTGLLQKSSPNETTEQNTYGPKHSKATIKLLQAVH